MQAVLLKCHHCDRFIWIAKEILEELYDFQEHTSKENQYLDFVCPNCGYGKRRTIQEIPEPQERDPLSYPGRHDLCHVRLRCEKNHCEPAKVHTLKNSDSSTETPRKPVRDWTLEGIRCIHGHPLRVPLEEIVDSWATAK